MKDKILREHYGQHFGDIGNPIYPDGEADSYVKVYQTSKNGKRDHCTTITENMSARPQETSEEHIPRFVELLAYSKEKNPKVARILSILAKRRDEYNCSFSHGVIFHDLLEVEPGKQEMVSAIFMAPYHETENFYSFPPQPKTMEELICFIWVFPITPEEYIFAMEYGPNALIDILMAYPLEYFLEENRNSVVKMIRKGCDDEISK